MTQNLNKLRNGTRLCKAASLGNEDRLNQLLKKVDANLPDYDGRTALHLAVANNQLGAVKLLLAKGAKVDSVDRWGGTPLDDAERQHNKEMIDLLMQKGATKTQGIKPELIGAFLQAAHENDQTKIQTLLDLNPGIINAKDYDKRSALHIAVCAGHYNLVKFLVSKGADVNALDRWNSTPLKEANRYNMQQISNFLEISDASPGPVEADPHLPMMFSVFARVLDVPNTPEDVKKDIIFTVDSLIEKFGKSTKELIRDLPATQTNTLKKHLLEKYKDHPGSFEDWVSGVIEIQSKLESHVFD